MSGVVEGQVIGVEALGEDLLWRDIRLPPCGEKRPALFLDRDGVIVEECRYLVDPARVALLPGIDTLIMSARLRGYAVVGVTNQGGIGLGLFGWAEFAAIEARIAELLASRGVGLDGVFACPYHPRGQAPYLDRDHPWRKPNPGMLLEAARCLKLDLGGSLMLGDKASDVLAARAAGLRRAVHLLSGHGRVEESASQSAVTTDFQVVVASGPGDVDIGLF